MTEAEREAEKAKTAIWFMSETLAQKFIGVLHANSINIGAYAQDTLVIMKRDLTKKEVKTIYAG